MTFVVQQAAMNRLLRQINGPVSRYIDAKATLVEEAAFVNASGRPGPNVRTGDLRRLIRKFGPQRGLQGELRVLIGSAARHGGVSYPTLQELGGITARGIAYRYQFLEPALRKVFGQGG